MECSQVHDWMDGVALSSLVSRNHKRQFSHSDSSQDMFAGISSPDIYVGLSSPTQSIHLPALDAKLRTGPSPKRRRVDIPTASTPSLGHPSEDGKIAAPTQSAGSTATTGTHHSGADGRTRQRSPVENMGDLLLAEKPIQFSTPKTRGGVPNDVTGLLMHILAVLDGIKIIPQSMVEAAEKHRDLLDPSINERNTYTANHWLPHADGQDGKITWDVTKEFELLEKIVAKSAECDAEDLSEPSWNTTVHHPFLELALAPFQGTVSHWDVTKARINEIYSPLHSSGNDLQAKMVDFCITLDGEAIKDRVITQLKMNNQSSISHTEYQPLRFRPIAVSIETKTPAGSTETARAQLAVWASSHIARLRELAATSDKASGLDISLPLISIQGAAWDLLLAVDHATSVEIVRIGPIGNTTSIMSCYKLLAVLRWLTVWVNGAFREWVVKNALVVS